MSPALHVIELLSSIFNVETWCTVCICMYRILCFFFSWQWFNDAQISGEISFLDYGQKSGIHGMKWSILGEHHGTSMNFLNPSSEPTHLGCLESLYVDPFQSQLAGAGRYWKATGSAGLPVHQIKAWRRDLKSGSKDREDMKPFDNLFVKWRFTELAWNKCWMACWYEHLLSHM